MKYLVALLGILFFVSTANAELAVCFQASRPLGSQFYYNPSIDPTKVADVNCTVVTAASGQTASQLTLINSTIRGVAAPRYLKVTSGLAAQMTVAEMDAVDADLAAKAAAQQLFIDEGASDYCSSATLAAVNTYLANINASVTTDIDAITNVATAKTAMTTMKNQFGLAIQKLARCIITIRKGVR